MDGTAGNLIAVLEGQTEGSVLLAAHVDRVQNGFGIKPQVRDGKIVSDGTTVLAADDLSGVAAILDGLRRVRHPAPGTLGWRCSSRYVKRSACRSTLHLDPAQFQSKFGFVLDSPGRIGKVLDSAMGKAELFLEVTGKSAHAAYPELGVSATRAAVLLLSRLGDGRIDDETVLNWSYLVAPGPCNAIPDKASAKAFAMSRDNDKLAAYLNAFVDAAAQVAEETGAKMDASYVVNYPSFYVPSDRPPIRIMERVFSKLGIPISVQHGAGGLDANRLNGYGIECVGLATGYSGNHTVNEVLELEDLIRSGEMVEQIILESAAV
ncbi:MAG: peptidase dimerization domain-containing protein [Intestinimonas sp.]